MLEYVRAVRDIRPRWMVWENVPGVLSQDGGRAFATLLGELEECGYCLAWRVLDAQFFGVAQRRRRVFLVGGPTVGRAAAVLFEPGCVPGSSGASRAKRASLARAAGERAQGEGGGCLTPGEHQSQCIWGADGPAPTLPSRSEHSGDHTPAIAFKPHKAASSGTPSIGDDQSPAVAFKPDKAATSGSQSVSIEQSPSLMSSHHAPAVAFVHFAGSKTRSIGYGEELSPTLTDSSAHQPAVAFCQNTRDEVRLMGGGGQVAGALCAEPGMKQQTYVAYRKDGEDDGEDG